MKKFINFFIAIKANITLWYASSQADRAYKGKHRVGTNRDGTARYNRNNCRYYVMPDENDRLICMNRQEFHKLRTKLFMSSEAKVKHLIQESFYYTPNANGKDALSPEIREFKRKKFVEYSIITYHRKARLRKLVRKYKKARKKALKKQRA